MIRVFISHIGIDTAMLGDNPVTLGLSVDHVEDAGLFSEDISP